MLAAQLKEIAEIDRRIQCMHQELAALHQRRSSILLPVVGPGQSTKNANHDTQQSDEAWSRQEYAHLVESWKTNNIQIPAYRLLSKRLLKTKRIIEDIEAADRRLRGHLSVVLVPPANLLPFSLTTDIRKHQQFVNANDYVSYEFANDVKSAKWRILVVFDWQEGLFIRSPKDTVDDKSYLIAGYDTRALGAYEYAIFSLHQTTPIDQDSWIVLFREQRNDSLLPRVTFTDARFFFDLDDMNNLFGDDYFRPAVEV